MIMIKDIDELVVFSNSTCSIFLPIPLYIATKQRKTGNAYITYNTYHHLMNDYKPSTRSIRIVSSLGNSKSHSKVHIPHSLRIANEHSLIIVALAIHSCISTRNYSNAVFRSFSFCFMYSYS